jgi:RNA polymerase sigma factor (sigma-70 family)
MTGATDQILVRDYARRRREQAFDELVHRHLDFVYSTAVRVLRDSSLAEDVTQRVFMALAQHAANLQGRTSLTGWLHETARNFAISAVRSEERRRVREQEAETMRIIDAEDTDALWQAITLHLDEVLSRLSSGDRDVILWRYFERKTAGQIGERLGLSGEAAQKRVLRALDRLRTMLAERGLTASAAGLAGLLTAQAIQSAPAGLAASVVAAAGVTGPALSATSIFEIIMASTKAKIGLAAVLAASVSAPLLLQHQRNARLLDEITTLRQQRPELDRLREEMNRLHAEAFLSAEQREKERAELVRIRRQLADYRTRDTSVASAPLNEKASKLPEQTDSRSSSAPLVRETDWKNVGFQTPSSTVQTLEWAKARRETNVIANALAWADEKSRAGIEAIFAKAPESVRAKFGSADEYVLSLFDFASPPDNPRRLTSFRILEERITGDEATLLIEHQFADGETHTGPMRYVRIGNDWRQALDFDEPAKGKLASSLDAN